MIKVKVNRRRWNPELYFYGDDFATYRGEGPLAPRVNEIDADGRHFPGRAYMLFVPEKGKDSEGDQKGQRYFIYGARLRLYSYTIIEGWVTGDGTRQAEHASNPGPEQFHLERWDIETK
jgi:hypothetical protein